MEQRKKSVTARIPIELYDKCNQQHANMTDAVIAGLELLCNTNCNTNVIAIEERDETIELKIRVEEKDARVRELQEQLKNKDDLQETRINDLQGQIKSKDENQQARIADLKDQINSLHEQLRIKDSQIEKLNDNMQGQVANIFNLTKENRLLPEPKNKKWWQIWKN